MIWTLFFEKIVVKSRFLKITSSAGGAKLHVDGGDAELLAADGDLIFFAKRKMVLRRYFYKILFEIVLEVHIVGVLSKFKILLKKLKLMKSTSWAASIAA